MPFSLQIDEGEFAGRRYVFDQEEVSFGRTDENDVVVPSTAASRHHARVSQKGEDYEVEDLRSSNGTRVNGEPLLRPLLLEDGDVIEIGQIPFKFSPYAVANATRIVATANLPPWEKGRAKAPERRVALAKPKSPVAQVVERFQALPKRQRVLIAAGAGMILLFMLGRGLRAPARIDPDAPELVEHPYALGATPEDHCYGQGGGTARIAPRGVGFSFNFSEPVAGKSLVTLHAQISGVRHADDVDLLLNGQHLAFLPATFDDTRPLDLILERAKLQPNAENTLELKPAKRPEMSWSVCGIWVEQVSLPSGTPAQLQAKAKEEYALGESKSQNENVAARNLYDSWHHYKEARKTLLAIPKPPEALRNLVDERLRDVENRLEKKCKQMMFTAQQAKITKGPDAAADAAADVFNYFPQSDHPCYERARQFLKGLAAE